LQKESLKNKKIKNKKTECSSLNSVQISRPGMFCCSGKAQERRTAQWVFVRLEQLEPLHSWSVSKQIIFKGDFLTSAAIAS